MKRAIKVICLQVLVFVASALPQGANQVIARTTPGQADIKLDYGLVCDPGCGSIASTFVSNLGPDVATNITVTFEIPAGARMGELEIDIPNRSTTQGNYNPGPITVEFPELAVGAGSSITIHCSLPNEEGWIGDVPISVHAAQVDSDESNNVLLDRLFVPRRPRVTSVDKLSEPFRLVLTGENLSLGPFGSVFVGNCDETYYHFEDEPQGTRLVILGGRQLKQDLPKGQPVTIHITNGEGGQLWFSYTR